MVCVCVLESPKLESTSKMESLATVLHWVTNNLSISLQTIKRRFFFKKLTQLDVNMNSGTETWSNHTYQKESHVS